MDTIHKKLTKLSIWSRKLHKKILNYKLGLELNPHAMRKPFFFNKKTKTVKKISHLWLVSLRKKRTCFQKYEAQGKNDT